MKFQFNHGSLERSPWFNCSCCPVNVVRFIPSVAGYIYACRGDSAYVNLFIASRGKVKLSSGAVVLTQHTRYPWDGSVKLTVEPAQAAEFALHLRIPGWAVGRPLPSDLYRYMPTAERQYTIKVNGAEVQLPVEKGFAVLRRKWERGDVVELDLPMPARRVLAHRKVEADRGRAAVERGPIVYCIEGADHHGKVLDIWLPDDAALTAAHQPDLLGGVTVLNGAAQRVRRRDDGSIATEPVELKMIPYFAWCHRGPNEMTVWIPRTTDVALAPLQ
jgi:DUF1680 family protein